MTGKGIKMDNLFVDFLEFKPENERGLFLILHGWGSRAEKWRAVGELLTKKGYRVIIPDLPGFGKSDEPATPWNLDSYCDFIEEFVKALALTNFFLLGHSFGGALAVKCSLKFSGKIDKLFLVGAACFRSKDIRKRLFYIIAKVLKIFSFFPGYQFFRKGFYKFIIRQSDYPYTDGVMKDIYLKIIKEDLSDTLSLVKVPTMIIWGEKDDVVPLKNAYLINRKIKNSQLVIIPKGDHYLEQKLPEKLSEIIL